ncbi:MAG: hypothetical protein JXQ75_13000 [Phycisphaerae bacterium]|nr:hypothetical protein [Phycisphaerae bacterium]
MDPRKKMAIVFALAGGVLLYVGAPTRGQCLFSPGDVNEDVKLDGEDVQGFVDCLLTGVTPNGNCDCADMDDNDVVDADDMPLFVSTLLEGAACLFFEVVADTDDGTEVNDSDWHPNGYEGTNLNRMGKAPSESYDVGLRFHLQGVHRGDTFVYARLVVPGAGTGQVDSKVLTRIVGIDQTSPPEWSSQRPSHLPKTDASVDWNLTSSWPEAVFDDDCSPLLRYSPDVSPVINEIIARQDWGSGPDGDTLALVVEGDGSSETNFLAFGDRREIVFGLCQGTVCPKLELYRTIRSTFLGTELLGRPTAHSVTVNAFSLLTLEVYFEYGVAPGPCTDETPVDTYPGETPIEVVLDGLSVDTAYVYQMRYRRPGDASFLAGPLRSFHTQRPPGSTFTFTVQADSHLRDTIRMKDQARQDLYRQTLHNARMDDPDFHIDLGDTFHCEHYIGRDVLDFQEAVTRHLDQRPYLGRLCHSAPFFFALGNHEGEQGWRLDGTRDNVAVWATNARKMLYPLPVPDDFYSGSTDEPEFVGLREDYYAWEWGDALFVVLDPFWYTTTKPHSWGCGTGSADNWDWTLGQEQYDWLVATLEGSSATFKFIFSHHVTGGVNTYGRGGVEAATHVVPNGRGSFEWGGLDIDGIDVFDEKRPGWGEPVHQVMLDNKVSIFFHGHDHVFVKQDLDGIVYQECPQPSDDTYGDGCYWMGLYLSGDKVSNTGHVRVTVSSTQVLVEYIRAWLPGDGPNGEVAYSYTVP